MRVLEQFFRGISGQRDKIIVHNLKDAQALHADPYLALPVFEQHRDAPALECFRRVQGQHFSILPQYQPGIRANPESSSGIFCQGSDGIGRQPRPAS